MTPLGELIATRICEDGPISFAEFMEIALYHPELGYYARTARRTGRAGDFFTSVDVGPVFGELLARQFAEMWRILRGSRFDLVEAGAGNGRLARDVLDAARRSDPEFYAAISLSLVERSATARAAHAEVLGPHAPLLHHSGPSLPERVRGLIYANELLDAMPTHAVAMTSSGLKEVFVDVEDGRFVERFDEPSTPKIAEYLARAGAALGEGWRAEVNLAAEEWVAAAAGSIDAGFLLIIDYGHEQGQLYGSTHAAGTLTMFRQHTSGLDLQHPGDSDITAHVDLTAVKRAAESAGMAALGGLDQTYFLLGLGLEELMTVEQGFQPDALRRRLALKTLVLPEGLGSTHKVLLFAKNVGTPALRGLSYRTRIT